MRCPSRSLLIAWSLATSAASAAEPVVAAWSEEGVAHAELEAVVPRSAVELWPALSAYEAQHAWVPYMRAASLSRVERGRAVCVGVTDLPWPLQDRTWTIDMRTAIRGEPGARTFVASWEYVPGSGNIDDTRGSWTLEELPGGRTRVRLEATAAIGRSVPWLFLRWAERKALPGMLDALVEQADRNKR